MDGYKWTKSVKEQKFSDYMKESEKKKRII